MRALIVGACALCAAAVAPGVAHVVVDGEALASCARRLGYARRRRRFRGQNHVWRGTLMARDAAAGKAHDLVSVAGNLVFLRVPKVASSSASAYVRALGGAVDVRWDAAVRDAPEATTFAFTRDPLERFVSALGTLAHRERGDGWSRGSVAAACGNATRASLSGSTVGRFSYAAAARSAACVLEYAEASGPFFDHHLAPQLSYYVAADAAGNCSEAAPLGCVRQPAPVRAFPVRDAAGGSNVQRAFDAAARAPLAVRLPDAALNVQEGRFKRLNYTKLLAKLGPHFARRVCRLYEDDYACLDLAAPDACRPALGDHHPGGFYADPVVAR